MKKRFKKQRTVIFAMLVILIVGVPGVVLAESGGEPDRLEIVPMSITGLNVYASRTSSTKVSYEVTAGMTPAPPTATLKTWKCKYSSGNWVAEGSAKVFPTIKKATYVEKSGSFTVTAGKKYKIRATLTESTGISRTAFSGEV